MKEWKHLVTDRPQAYRMALITLLVTLYVILFLPFWKALVLGFLFASACQPLIRTMQERFVQRRKSAAYLGVALTLGLVGALIAVLALNTYSLILEILHNPDTLGSFNERLTQFKTALIQWIQSVPTLRLGHLPQRIDAGFSGFLESTQSFAMGLARETLMEAPIFFLNLFVFFLAFGAFLILGPKSTRILTWMLDDANEAKKYYRQFEETCVNSLGSIFVTAFVQALVVCVGASLAGFESLFVIFVLTFICAMLPVVGAGMVGLTLALFKLAEGDGNACVIMLTMAAVAGIADNLMMAWLFSRAAKTNVAISLISLLGGIALMGFAGLFVAPVVEQLVMRFLTGRHEEETQPQMELRRFQVSEKTTPVIAPGTG